MDIYRRVEELTADKETNMTDGEFFTSAEFHSYLSRKLTNIVTGTVHYLNSIGIPVTKTTEKKLIKSIQIVVEHDTNSGKTASFGTDRDGKNKVLEINTGNRLIELSRTRKEKFWAVLGMFYHELGHALFTDFPTTLDWNAKLSRKAWMPETPHRITSGETPEIENGLATADDEFIEAFIICANSIDNCVEDGYIENEIRAMFPGMASRCLATLNTSLIEGTLSLSDSEENTQTFTVFGGLMSQVLMYAKFGEMNLGTYKGPLLDPLMEIVDLMDASFVTSERHPEARKATVNELLCILFPYMNDEIERIKEELKKQKEAGENPNSLSEEMKKIISDIMGSMGANNGNGSGQQGVSGGNSKSIATPTSPAGAGTSNGNTAGDASGGTQNGGAGATSGDSSLDAAERDMEAIQKKIATNSANEQAECERTTDMQNEANAFDFDEFDIKNGGIVVERAAAPSAHNINQYNKVAEVYVSAAKDLQRGIAAILKDRKEQGKLKNLPFGRRFEVSSVVHGDGKYFSKNKVPSNPPSLSVGILVDESGSVTQDLSDASVGAALVVEEFCKGLKIPLIVNGYTTGGGSNTAIISYVTPEEIDDGDKYRITGMSSRGGTPTTKSLCYMISKMRTIPSDVKLLIVITDGQSGDNYEDAIRRVIKKAERDNFVVIAAGIGINRKDVQEEFGEKNYLDISNVKEMPNLLLELVKANVKF